MAFDISELQGLLGQFGPTEEEKRAAKMQAIAQFGLGLLGTQKGQEWDRVGRSGAYALQSQGDALHNASAQKMQSMQAAGQAMELQQRMAQQRAAEAQGAKLADWQKQLPALMNGPSPAEQVGSGAPTVDNAARVKPPAKWQIYQNLAEKAAAAGLDAQAKEYMGWAEKHKPEVKSEAVRMENGVPVVVKTYKDGSEEKSAFNPTPDTQMVTLGDRTIAVDKNTVQPGQSFAFGQSPDSKASNALGWANFGLSKQRDAREAAKSNEPAWVNDLDRGLQIDPRSGQTRPITAAGQPVGAKGETKQAEASGRALQIIAQAKPLVAKATNSFIGAGYDKAAQAFGASPEGATATAQLKALEGALMMNQPRMEGPQSDKDTALYRMMAAQIGDPTVPREQKMAALQTVEELHKRYMAGGSGARGGVAPAKTVHWNDLK